MVTPNHIVCPICHKQGPYIGSCDEMGLIWKLCCVFCGHIIESTEKAVMNVMWTQQMLVTKNNGCPNCHQICPVKARMPANDSDNIMEAIHEVICSNCGFTARITPTNIEKYLDRLDKLLNP